MKQNNYLTVGILIFVFLGIGGCVTPSSNPSSFFMIKKQSRNATEILVTPDRVLLQCEKQVEYPEEGRYGFIIHILDDENTVVTSSLDIQPDKKGCESFLKKVSHILKNSKRVYIGGHGVLRGKPREEDKQFPQTFPGHGTFYHNSRDISFDVIANDKGECYSPSYRRDEPCPQYPFPIEKYEKELMK